MGDQLAIFGEKLASFSGYVTDLDFGDDSNLTSAIGVLDKVGQIHSKLGDLDITQIKAFENIGSALESFFGSLGRIVTSQSSEFNKTDKKVTIDEALDAMYYFEDIDSGPFIEKITKFVNDIVSAANAADAELKTAATNLTTTKDALSGALVGSSQDAFASLTSGFSTGVDTSPVDKAATDMVAAFKSHGNEFYGAGGYFTLGLAGGASKYLSTAANAAAAVAAAMLAKVREVFNSASPSKETAKYGMWFDQGLAVGVRDYANEATTSSEDVANAMLKTTSGTLSNLSAILAGDIDDTPTISPVVDLTNARAAAASIGGMFGAQSVPIYSRNLAYNVSNPGVVSRFNTAGRSDSAGASSSDSANLASSIDTLNSRMSSLEFAIKNMKVVTETGAIIGQIASGMDDKLGEFARMHERGG